MQKENDPQSPQPSSALSSDQSPPPPPTDTAKSSGSSPPPGSSDRSLVAQVRGAAHNVRHTQLGRYQARAFGLTWLSYASYYMTRKPIGVIKPALKYEMGYGNTALGTLDTAYLAAYAVGQFVHGYLGDRIGSRRLLAMGMLGTALCAFLFGLNSLYPALVLALLVNGFFQGSGWPGNIKAMTPWFGLKTRGTVMGFWGTCYQVGSVVGTWLASFVVVRWGWRAAWITPGMWVVLIAILVFFTLVDHPRDVGLEAPSDADIKPAPKPTLETRDTAVEAPPEPDLTRSAYLRLFNLGAAYFCLKLIRYTLWFWLPLYFVESLGYAQDVAGYLSIPFDVGGIAGAIIIGYLSDRYVAGRRVIMATPLVFGIAVCLLLYELTASFGIPAIVISMALVGFMLFGPDSLLSGAAAQDLGGPRAAARAAGIINGLGSLGPILQGWMTGYVSKTYGWDALFYLLMGLAVLATVLLTPVLILDIRKKPE